MAGCRPGRSNTITNSARRWAALGMALWACRGWREVLWAWIPRGGRYTRSRKARRWTRRSSKGKCRVGVGMGGIEPGECVFCLGMECCSRVDSGNRGDHGDARAGAGTAEAGRTGQQGSRSGRISRWQNGPVNCESRVVNLFVALAAVQADHGCDWCGTTWVRISGPAVVPGDGQMGNVSLYSLNRSSV